ncbi:IclR family transcriptional regulator [Nocardia halotolerans]|uniref:IclR family transcriptional regulator n=1 Tax=Nocardia halotolerans TaxID=1755878 RepID=A0ABV8VHV1_9NOCA
MTDGADVGTVLGKSVTILRAFRADDQTLPLAELVRRTGLHKATVHRLARDLARNRLLDRSDEGYRLSGGLFELGMRASVERSLLEIAMPFIQDLYERTHETVHLGVRDGHDIVYLAKVGGHKQTNAPSRTGGRLPLYCTAIGKALLADAAPALRRAVLSEPLTRRTPHTVVAPGMLRRQLQQISKNGCAFEYEESAIGLVCVAAPIFGSDNTPVAAISIAGPSSRFRPDAHVHAVRAAAAGISRTLTRRDVLRDGKRSP